MPKSPVSLVLGLALAGLGFQYFPARANPALACDSAASIASVKSLALKRFKGNMSDYLFKGAASYHDQQIAHINANVGDVSLALGSFRNRGAIGSGIACAAILSITSSGQVSPVELGAEYIVEMTTDGQALVSARFTPN